MLVAQEFRDQRPNCGETGEFPEGAINITDEPTGCKPRPCWELRAEFYEMTSNCSITYFYINLFLYKKFILILTGFTSEQSYKW